MHIWRDTCKTQASGEGKYWYTKHHIEAGTSLLGTHHQQLCRLKRKSRRRPVRCDVHCFAPMQSRGSGWMAGLIPGNWTLPPESSEQQQTNSTKQEQQAGVNGLRQSQDATDCTWPHRQSGKSEIKHQRISFAHVAVGNIGGGADNSLESAPNLSLPPSIPCNPHTDCSLSPNMALAHGWLDSSLLHRVRHHFASKVVVPRSGFAPVNLGRTRLYPCHTAKRDDVQWSYDKPCE